MLQAGAADILRKPFLKTIVLRRIENTLYILKLKCQKRLEQNGKNQLIDVFGSIIQSRKIGSRQHLLRVRLYTEILLKNARDELSGQYVLDDSTISKIGIAAALHDIGKIAIPDDILLKPGPLTRDEFKIIKTHTIKGCEILSVLKVIADDKDFGYFYDICRYHHESYDGSGYPDGLVGDEIPAIAQIAAISDVYDTLITKRPYKDAICHEKAVEMIKSGQCGTFSPILLSCFLKVCDQFHQIALEYSGGTEF